MDIKRYIVIQALKTETNELIPFWSDRLKFTPTGDCGDSVLLDGNSWKNYFSFVDCIYDLKTKTISMGVEINSYPDINRLEFKINESVYYETKHRHLGMSKLIAVEFEEFDLSILKGSRIENYERSYFKDIEFDDNTLYAIKHWKPKYVLESGFKTHYEHQLHHISEPSSDEKK